MQCLLRFVALIVCVHSSLAIVWAANTTTTPATRTPTPAPSISTKCITNEQAKVRLCCSGDIPTLVHPVILWKMVPELCGETFCDKKFTQKLYIGNGRTLIDNIATKGNFSSKSERNVLLNAFLKPNASDDSSINATGWLGSGTGWNGETRGYRSYSRCQLNATSSSAWIDLRRSYAETL